MSSQVPLDGLCSMSSSPSTLGPQGDYLLLLVQSLDFQGLSLMKLTAGAPDQGLEHVLDLATRFG